VKPAWSWQFDADQLEPARPLALPTGITREWAWGGGTGRGVKVAVIDSGIDATHEAIGSVAGAVAVEIRAGGTQTEIVSGPHEDLFGHGTACAGIIRVAAPECDLYSVRVLGAHLGARGTAFAAGLRWAIDARMDVVNLSLGTGKREYFPVLHELVDDAYFRNIMVVSAADNVPVPSYPSHFASVFSVAAHERKDPFRFDYNPAPPVEFGAPGIDVDVAWRGGGRSRVTGNSFAAPHIAGLVARILSCHPGLTPFQMKTILHALADNAKG
jgi:subtilisin